VIGRDWTDSGRRWHLLAGGAISRRRIVSMSSFFDYGGNDHKKGRRGRSAEKKLA
jgi:hypothetical protein